MTKSEWIQKRVMGTNLSIARKSFGGIMTKAEWDKEHDYRKSEHTCSWCAKCESIEIDPWIWKLACLEKRKAGAGESVKPSYDCDLWEHR
jgi:hypothetical protein